ncbi:MAG: hypothetical protein AAB471_01260 [Patescibacteria group bacterium]
MNLSLEEKRIAYALNEACLYIKRLLDGGGGCNDTVGWNVCVHREEWENHEPYIRIILCGAYRVREELQAIFSTFQPSDDFLTSLEIVLNPFPVEEEDWKLLTLRSGWDDLWNACRLAEDAEEAEEAEVVVRLPRDQYEVIERVIRGTSDFLGKNLSH